MGADGIAGHALALDFGYYKGGSEQVQDIPRIRLIIDSNNFVAFVRQIFLQ